MVQDFIINESHAILIVVDQLTYTEQKMIMKLFTTKYKNALKNKIIIITHNLKHQHTVAKVKSFIKSEIEDIFKVSKLDNLRYGDHDIYIDNSFASGDDQKHIYHILLGNDYSKAGEEMNEERKQMLEYNQKSIQFIKDTIFTAYNTKTFDVIERLTDYANSHFRNYIEDYNFKEMELTEPITNAADNRYFITSKKDSESKTIKLKHLLFDVWGNIDQTSESKEFAPKYTFIKEACIDENCKESSYEIIGYIELAGKIDPEIEVGVIRKENGWYICARGKRVQVPEEQDLSISKDLPREIPEGVKGNIPFGDFLLDVLIAPPAVEIDPNSLKLDYCPNWGILKVKLHVFEKCYPVMKTD
jgi:hypothetical protein